MRRLTICLGVAVAVAAFALLMVAPGERPEAETDGTGGETAGPSCPAEGPTLPAPGSSAEAAELVALEFASAWWSGDHDTVAALADRGLADDVGRLDAAAQAAAAADSGAVPDVARLPIVDRVAPVGHNPQARALAFRCGPELMPALLVVTVHPSGGRQRSDQYLVRRPQGYRVWAVR